MTELSIFKNKKKNKPKIQISEMLNIVNQKKFNYYEFDFRTYSSSDEVKGPY